MLAKSMCFGVLVNCKEHFLGGLRIRVAKSAQIFLFLAMSCGTSLAWIDGETQALLDSAMELQLVLLPFSSSSPSQVSELKAAAVCGKLLEAPGHDTWDPVLGAHILLM